MPTCAVQLGGIPHKRLLPVVVPAADAEKGGVGIQQGRQGCKTRQDVWRHQHVILHAGSSRAGSAVATVLMHAIQRWGCARTSSTITPW